jgi:antitoxin component YwqK of YwqJK toxin-antitoxin module
VLKGFPLNLNARPAGDYYLESGNSRENTYFVVISRDGFRIKFTMDGKVHSRETLLKNVVDAQYRLVREENFKGYLVVRQETKQLTVFDENLKEIVVSDFIANNPTEIQYLDFGAGKSFIAITDKGQELSFVYDGQGKLLTPLPIESSRIAVRPLDLDKILIFSALGRALTITPM